MGPVRCCSESRQNWLLLVMRKLHRCNFEICVVVSMATKIQHQHNGGIVYCYDNMGGGQEMNPILNLNGFNRELEMISNLSL